MKWVAVRSGEGVGKRLRRDSIRGKPNDRMRSPLLCEHHASRFSERGDGNNGTRIIKMGILSGRVSRIGGTVNSDVALAGNNDGLRTQDDPLRPDENHNGTIWGK